jgi:1-aminocyclopropane-1-carboxylate deaminase/D-cysteine desulfhydrase-like pyridoxal-dependent ACC family enzyme
MATALATLMALPAAPLPMARTPVDRLVRLETALGRSCPRLFVKRDDLLPFGLGGNKVRKMQLLAAEAERAGADTLITCGAVHSNHARVTAAVGAVLGWRVILVLSGAPPDRPVGNFALCRLFGAQVRPVPTNAGRDSAMAAAADEVRAEGGRPFVIPVGASVPTGAMAIARAVAELGTAGVRPDVIVHASSSGGTQAGLIAGCALLGLPTRVLGVSADEPEAALGRRISGLLDGMASALGARPATVGADRAIAIDDTQVGTGYGIPTAASTDARTFVARHEGIVLDPVYTAKAMAGLLAHIRAGAFSADQTVLFWHTGGLHGEW